MRFQFTHPWLLVALPLAVAWMVWLWVKSDVQVSAWRRWCSLGLRLLVTVAVCLALAGLQWLRPQEGLNVFYLLDRSDSIPSVQQEQARELVNQLAQPRKATDRGGVVVFGSEASIETMPNAVVDLKKVQAVIGTGRSDLAAGIQLGTAAFPETGQKRLVLMSDGNENLGDALASVLSARSLGVTLDVVPLGVARGGDVAVQKVSVPAKLKKGQTFDAKIFVQSDTARAATVRLFRNDQSMGETVVNLQAGKNLFTFPQTLNDSGFYSYDVRIESEGDQLPQNNRGSAFATVQGDPRVLVVSSDPAQDADLAAALRTTRLDVKLVGPSGFPGSLAEMQSYESIFLCNLEASIMGSEGMGQLESAVRDFGVGLVCIGGDKSFAAGGYRNTALDTTLPVSMELDSKKVLPPGAVVLVMHGMEFAGGNQTARDCAIGTLNALGPADEMGVLLWDGTERWLFELQKVGDRKKLGSLIAGMNQGDLGSFENILLMAHNALKKSRASLKHIIVFSDGDPAAPRPQTMADIVADKITLSTVLISGHAGPETMVRMAEDGQGRFYDVKSPEDLPQIFIKEAAVILKTAIYEDPFTPQVRSPGDELIRGLGPAAGYPELLGYVATSAKPRAETPLWTTQGDPLLAHWQYGLGRAVAFTSDARAKWARNWLGWAQYRQFWSGVARWSLRRLENADLQPEVSTDRGGGLVTVEAVDEEGNYRNFLNLTAIVADPKGGSQTVRLEQTGPGRYEARFPTTEVGTYMVNVQEIAEGRVRGAAVAGASVSYSPEFSEPEPNLNLLRRLAEAGGGKLLDTRIPADNPFTRDRRKTFQPRDAWEWLLQFALLLFIADIGIRRVQIERSEWLKATASLRRALFFWKPPAQAPTQEESLAALLARRAAVRQSTTAAGETRADLFQPTAPGDTPLPTEFGGTVATSATEAQTEIPPAPAAPPPESHGSASRLLEAKRRAQGRRNR
jgi:uncharacterized membrane protein